MKNYDFNYLLLIMNFLDLLMIFIMIMVSNLYNFHPLILSMLLVFYTIILSFKLNFIISSYWYSYIMFLVMIGGLMILFMYFASLVNNKMFYLSKNYMIYLIMKFFLLMLFIYLYFFKFNNLLYTKFIEENAFFYQLLFKDLDMYKNLMMDYIMDMNLYMIIYLFFMMVCSVLICMKINIPLRQMLKFN